MNGTEKKKEGDGAIDAGVVEYPLELLLEILQWNLYTYVYKKDLEWMILQNKKKYDLNHTTQTKICKN